MMGMSGGGRLTHAPRAAQQSVHLTCGSLRDLRAFFWLRAFSCSQAFSQPAHKQVTQTVRQPVAKRKESLNRKLCFMLYSEDQIAFMGGCFSF